MAVDGQLTEERPARVWRDAGVWERRADQRQLLLRVRWSWAWWEKKNANIIETNLTQFLNWWGNYLFSSNSVHPLSLSSPNASEWTVVLGRLNQNGVNQFEVSLDVVNISMSNLTGTNIAVLMLSSPPHPERIRLADLPGQWKNIPRGSRMLGRRLELWSRRRWCWTHQENQCKSNHFTRNYSFLIFSNFSKRTSAAVPDNSAKLWECINSRHHVHRRLYSGTGTPVVYVEFWILFSSIIKPNLSW